MIRIYIQDEAETTSLVVEGKLAWPWVEELEQCWRMAQGAEQPIEVNLADVVFVDDKGKELLAAMHATGAKLVANGLMTQAIIEEIVKRA
jgi:hypothetical protein